MYILIKIVIYTEFIVYTTMFSHFLGFVISCSHVMWHDLNG